MTTTWIMKSKNDDYYDQVFYHIEISPKQASIITGKWARVSGDYESKHQATQLADKLARDNRSIGDRYRVVENSQTVVRIFE